MKFIKIFLVILILGGAVYLLRHPVEEEMSLFANPQENLTSLVSSTNLAPDLAERIATPSEPPADYVEYKNEKYGFRYYHSPQAKITEFDEGGGAMTIVQENEQKMRGLQIFVVPYLGETISDEQFKRDVPSGVRYNIENTKIGRRGIRAVTFNSFDEFIGETREVWFIFEGHLYEITTFKGFGDWLAPILQTWRFS